ncbi:MAG: hypothetical protein HOP29_05455 [Phycisphaerales bacterium]|nr:hypothetical protein [Phycisphaerales bacterium]
MPVQRRKAKPPHSRPDLVRRLAVELKSKEGRSARTAKNAPLVIEEEQTYGRALHVTVIWDKWSGVPLEERGAIITDAYRQAGRDAELEIMTLVMGVTAQEAGNLGIS